MPKELVLVSVSPKNRYGEYLVTPKLDGKAYYPGTYYSMDIEDAAASAMAMVTEYRRKGYVAELSPSKSTTRAIQAWRSSLTEPTKGTGYEEIVFAPSKYPKEVD